MPPLLDHWLEAKLRRYAVPSAFGPPITRLLAPSLGLALRASVNAVQKRSQRFCQTRNGLARHSCRASGEVAHLSVVFNAKKPVNRCLCGSEHRRQRIGVQRNFLSCLLVSERSANHDNSYNYFLSCLNGSEHDLHAQVSCRIFLSCLYGSELPRNPRTDVLAFLSCLYGSEP